MDYDDQRHTAAIGALPALLRVLFRLHNFYGVEIGIMADKLATDADDILACLADARAMIHRQFPIWARKQPTSANMSPRAMDLERRLRLDYRASVEASFAEGGYTGAVLWRASYASIDADEEAAAIFVLKSLRWPLQKAHARAAKPDVATVDLRRHTPSWRWVQRRRLREIGSEIYCSGLRSFDLWLADRIAPDLHYPSRLLILPHRRRALPEELDPRQEGYHLPCWPNDAARQQRFDRLPILTQHVAALILLYGRSRYEIARRLGISRRRVGRCQRDAIIAITFRPTPPFAKAISYDVRLLWRLLKRWMRRRFAARGTIIPS